MPYIPVPLHTENAHLRRSRRFKRAMDEAVRLRSEIDEREARIAELKTQHVEPELTIAGVVGRVGYTAADGRIWQVSVVDRREGQKLDRKRLVAAMSARGYDVSVIGEALVTTPGAHYVELRSPKDAAADTDADTDELATPTAAPRKLARLA